jgi:hypothetical protein
MYSACTQACGGKCLFLQRLLLCCHDCRESDPQPDLDPKVVEVYKAVGDILSRYTSGKVPKALKIIPSLSNWEDVLYLTAPDNWTPHACYEATKIFVSNLNQKMVRLRTTCRPV